MGFDAAGGAGTGAAGGADIDAAGGADTGAALVVVGAPGAARGVCAVADCVADWFVALGEVDFDAARAAATIAAASAGVSGVESAGFGCAADSAAARSSAASMRANASAPDRGGERVPLPAELRPLAPGPPAAPLLGRVTPLGDAPLPANEASPAVGSPLAAARRLPVAKPSATFAPSLSDRPDKIVGSRRRGAGGVKSSLRLPRLS